MDSFNVTDYEFYDYYLDAYLDTLSTGKPDCFDDWDDDATCTKYYCFMLSWIYIHFIYLNFL